LRAQKANWYENRILGDTVPRKLPIKILFIGNSYTGVNDLPGMLLQLSKDANATPALIVDQQVQGGFKLHQQWDDGTALQKIQSNDWDFVVLQEQSQWPVYNTQDFKTYARKFEQEIKAQRGITIFFLTWERKNPLVPIEGLTTAYTSITK